MRSKKDEKRNLERAPDRDGQYPRREFRLQPYGDVARRLEARVHREELHPVLFLLALLSPLCHPGRRRQGYGLQVRLLHGVRPLRRRVPDQRESHRHGERRDQAGRREEKMKATKILNGNQAIAEAARQIDPDVIAASPITPSTAIVETIASFRADGLIKGEFVCPESEHSAMSVCIGAASAGGRVMTATSSQGLALMWEMLYIAAGLRLPIVAAIANRALSAPINIHGDHSDTMGARDPGWIQIYSENCQEAYDNFIQAFRIGEHPDVLTPVLVGFDGFIISRSSEVGQVEDDDAVKKLIGEFKPPFPLLDTSRKFTVGPIDFTDYYFEHKRNQIEGIENSPRGIEEGGKEV